jgi:hypothetical protein
MTTPPPARITGNSRTGEELRRLVKAPFTAGAALDHHRLRNLAFDIAVKKVARNVELCGPKLELCAIERASGQLGHARAIVHMRLILGDPGKDRQLLGFLEATEADRRAAGFGVTTTTGECAQYAAAVEVTKLVIPGPFCAMQTPCLPDTRA